MRKHHTRPGRNRRTGLLAVAAPIALLAAFAAGCGDDDEPTATTETTSTTAADTTESTAGSAFPSDEFCAAQADLAEAQDGAQRNTAIGEMQDALGDDAPDAVVDALDTLLAGDLAPEEYTAAEQTLSDACS